MSDVLHPISLGSLAAWLFAELDRDSSAFGVPEELFFHPCDRPELRTVGRGVALDTPLGVAAGPHTQLAANIVTAWLAGARFIELKTVQTLDELDVAKPCIDMEDLGYNCEWSQELRLPQSLDEYVKAWLLIQALRVRMGHPRCGEGPGFAFNVSVGYDLSGVRQENVARFLDGVMATGSRCAELIADEGGHAYLDAVELPEAIADSVTLSTMHGCPPAEVERIGRFLIEERGLHTTVKLNPTLLGPEELRDILHGDLGHTAVSVPDEAFAHDLAYSDALDILRGLRDSARRRGLRFAVKLTNTLEVQNRRSVLPASQEMLYLSGRALHPLGVTLAARLSKDFGGALPISFAGGVDAFNVSEVVAAGLTPVTLCSDLLRPGGYGRLAQSVDRLSGAIIETSAADADDLAFRKAIAQLGASRFRTIVQERFAETGEPLVAEGTWARIWKRFERQPQPIAYTTRLVDAMREEGLSADAEAAVVAAAAGAARHHNLVEYARVVRRDGRYAAKRRDVSTKTSRALGPFDCVSAPCREGCPANQDIPSYLRLTAEGLFHDALHVVRRTNAMPHTTGAVCDQPCATKCVRTHYDAPLAIRAVKRFLTARGRPVEAPQAGGRRRTRVAVVGAGPAGLAVARFLAAAGYDVTVLEASERAGGVPGDAIPPFRLPQAELAADIEAVRKAGAAFRFGVQLGRDTDIDDLFADGYRYVFLGLGGGAGRSLGVPGDELDGVVDGLRLLSGFRSGRPARIGPRVVVVGGGNSAMDAARTAVRMTGEGGSVEILYRRTRAEMPADPEEVELAEAEGVAIRELINPVEVEAGPDGRVAALRCQRMRLGAPDASGRPRPEPIEGAEERVGADTVVVAIGQRPSLGAIERAGVRLGARGTIEVDPGTQETSRSGVFAGGDVVTGPSDIVAAVAAARRASRAIRLREGESFQEEPPSPASWTAREHMVRRALRVAPDLPHTQPGGDVAAPPLDDGVARAEAGRCLRCDEFCALCVTVCPNRANVLYEIAPRSVVLPSFVVDDGHLRRADERVFSVRQRWQITNIADLCNECGNCATFCPTAGAPYRDKPRLCISPESYAAEPDGWRLEGRDRGWQVRCRSVEGEHSLTLTRGELVYEGPAVRLSLSSETLSPKKAALLAPLPEGSVVELDRTFRMWTVGAGLAGSRPYLPCGVLDFS